MTGSILSLPVLFTAVISPASEWTSPPGRFLTSIWESGMTLFFIITVILVISGVILIVNGISKEDKS